MRLPRDISGEDLARLLRRYGYEITRQTGSHMRLASTFKGTVHHITIPAHRQIRIGVLSAVLADAAAYLEIDRQKLLDELFGR